MEQPPTITLGKKNALSILGTKNIVGRSVIVKAKKSSSTRSLRVRCKDSCVRAVVFHEQHQQQDRPSLNVVFVTNGANKLNSDLASWYKCGRSCGELIVDSHGGCSVDQAV